MARPLEQNMGADAMRAATGCDHEGWRSLLADAGALEWTHAQTARWLVEKHGVDGWWAQGITVDFEQARKGRMPGQQADGTFTTQRARTISGDRLNALRAVADVVTARHGEPHGESLQANQPNVRWRLADGTRLQAAAGLPNNSGTPVTLTHSRLPSHEAIGPAKDAIDGILAAAIG